MRLFIIITTLLATGCASTPQRISPDQVRAIEEAITDRLYSAMHDRMDCDIVDRVYRARRERPHLHVRGGLGDEKVGRVVR